MASRDDILEQFRAVTACSKELAEEMLSNADYNLEVALTNFYELQEDEGAPPEPIPAPLAASSATKPLPRKPGESSSGSRFATLASLNRPAKDDEDQGQAFYAGGSDTSGQQILGPPRKNPIQDYVSEIFRNTQQHQHDSDTDSPPPPATTTRRLFTGSGFRLGHEEEEDTVMIAGEQAAGGSSGGPQHETVVLKLWRQGFSINDGELRSYMDPGNREFFESIMKGEIPTELRKNASTVMHLDIEDHRMEDFVAPKPTLKVFSGEGRTLGSPAPNVVESPKTPTAPTAVVAAAETVKLDDAQPVTTIQVRLEDGSRLTGRFNHGHTVADIRQFIVASRPALGAVEFSLLSSFPVKELTDDAATLKDAGLLGAAIIQRSK